MIKISLFAQNKNEIKRVYVLFCPYKLENVCILKNFPQVLSIGKHTHTNLKYLCEKDNVNNWDSLIII